MKDYLTNSIKKESNGIALEQKKTDLRKEAFIQEMKNGLGEEIKLNPNRVEVVIKAPIKRDGCIKRFFKKIFKVF
jgi:hypothetical protein|tara:strand:+ start:516 stop:740 length:225 start_codon:yes stop_codon:yes gene_type:complete